MPRAHSLHPGKPCTCSPDDHGDPQGRRPSGPSFRSAKPSAWPNTFDRRSRSPGESRLRDLRRNGEERESNPGTTCRWSPLCPAQGITHIPTGAASLRAWGAAAPLDMWISLRPCRERAPEAARARLAGSVRCRLKGRKKAPPRGRENTVGSDYLIFTAYGVPNGPAQGPKIRRLAPGTLRPKAVNPQAVRPVKNEPGGLEIRPARA